MRQVPAYSAIVLAGGEARRMGGRHKPALPVGGISMLDRVLSAVADADHRIVVGPPQEVPAGVRLTRETPAGGGPVAAIAAGMEMVTSGRAEFVAVLAGDQPFLTAHHVAVLLWAVTAPVPPRATRRAGAVFADGGRPQFLCGMWRVAALRERLAELADPRGLSVRTFFAGLEFVPVPTSGPAPPPWYDCDTESDLSQAERWLAMITGPESAAKPHERPTDPGTPFG
jgi:molybdenum cofactor guanylyltransferase